MSGWAMLALTILLEIAGTTFMKLSNGFTAPWPSAGAVLCYVGAAIGLTLALKELPLSTAYAIWSGAGIAVTTLIGIAWFDEPAPLAKLASLVLVLVGVVGLQLSMAGTGTR